MNKQINVCILIILQIDVFPIPSFSLNLLTSFECGYINVCRVPIFLDYFADLIHKIKYSIKVHSLTINSIDIIIVYEFPYLLKFVVYTKFTINNAYELTRIN